MPDGCVPWENLWSIAVMQFGQQADVAWRMDPKDVWVLIDMKAGFNPSIKDMTQESFKAMQARLKKDGYKV